MLCLITQAVGNHNSHQIIKKFSKFKIYLTTINKYMGIQYMYFYCMRGERGEEVEEGGDNHGRERIKSWE